MPRLKRRLDASHWSTRGALTRVLMLLLMMLWYWGGTALIRYHRHHPGVKSQLEAGAPSTPACTRGPWCPRPLLPGADNRGAVPPLTLASTFPILPPCVTTQPTGGGGGGRVEAFLATYWLVAVSGAGLGHVPTSFVFHPCAFSPSLFYFLELDSFNSVCIWVGLFVSRLLNVHLPISRLFTIHIPF